jgi:hypothetical protein
MNDLKRRLGFGLQLFIPGDDCDLHSVKYGDCTLAYAEVYFMVFFYNQDIVIFYIRTNIVLGLYCVLKRLASR